MDADAFKDEEGGSPVTRNSGTPAEEQEQDQHMEEADEKPGIDENDVQMDDDDETTADGGSEYELPEEVMKIMKQEREEEEERNDILNVSVIPCFPVLYPQSWLAP